MGKAKNERAAGFIPDYDHLFSEEVVKNGKVKNKFISKLIALNIWPILLSCLIYIVQFSPVIITPLFISDIINVATVAIAENVGATSDIMIRIATDSAVIVFFILLNVPTTRLRFYVASKMLRRTSAGVKSAVIKKLQGLSITYHKDMESGKIQSKFLRDTESFDTFFNLLVHNVFTNVISVIMATVVAFVKSGYVSLFFLLVIPINVGMSFLFRKKIKTKAREFRLNNENMGARITTMIEMMPVIKAHGLEATEYNSVRAYISKVENSGVSLDRTIGHFGALNWVVNTLLGAVCVVFCVFLALNRVIEIGDVVLYQSLFTTISSYVSSLIAIYPQIATGVEGANSLSELMNAKDVEISLGKSEFERIEGNVKFDHVCYHYPGSHKAVLSDVSLDVKKGECIAIVGSSGSGKTTLVNMVIGLLKPTSGKLFIDGKSIDDYNLSEYRHNISVVPQNAVLFSGTIKDNITYGLDKYTDEDVKRVVSLANVDEFLPELPNGIDTNVGERGDKLSGGQRQRVTIARALIRNPKILILDEATSALDNVSEFHVQKAISESVKGRTTFIVAHRLSTIRGADRIVVMEEGRIVEIGDYNELMAKRGKFYELKVLSDINTKAAEEGLNQGL